MSIAEGIYSSYSMFGLKGVALTAKARIQKRHLEVAVCIRGVDAPMYIRLRTTDVSLLAEILECPEYNLTVDPAPDVILDVGANSGLTSVFFAIKYPNARIIAIEPESSNFRLLQMNTRPYPNVLCLQAALWKSNTLLRIADPGCGHWGFQTSETTTNAVADCGVDVEGITVDGVMERFDLPRIDYLRMDIEGAECEVFENASSWIDKVGVIAVELHDRFRLGCSRALYLATPSFQWELRQGETVLLGRKGISLSESGNPFLPMEISKRGSARSTIKRSCAIL